MRIGQSFAAHLEHALALGPTEVAPAGAKARIIVTDRHTPSGATAPQLTIEIVNFRITGGTMPVRPVTPVVTALDVGTTVPATTLGLVERIGERIQVRIPLPQAATSDIPATAFTPLVMQTPRKGATNNPYAPATRPPTTEPGSPADPFPRRTP